MMKSITVLSGLLIAGLFSVSANAQSWNAEQTAIWQAIGSTWDVKDEDGAWLSSTTHASVSGWNRETPAPRSRDAMINWGKLSRESGKAVIVELSPLNIVTANGAAVAHYYYSTMSESKEGKRETEHGSCTDTLIMQDKKWVYLGWSCGEISKE